MARRRSTRHDKPSHSTTPSTHQAGDVVAAPARETAVQDESLRTGSGADSEDVLPLFKNRAYLEHLQRDVAPIIAAYRAAGRSCRILSEARTTGLLPSAFPSEVVRTLQSVVRFPDLLQHMQPDERRAIDAVMQAVDFGCESDADVPAALLRAKEYAVRFKEAASALRKLEVRILAELHKLDLPTQVKEGKPSTARHEAREKLIAALTCHHEYENGGCLNTAPIGVNKLARLAKVSSGSASAFFKAEFDGHPAYKRVCRSLNQLVNILKHLNGESPSSVTYGGSPPEGRFGYRRRGRQPGSTNYDNEE